MKTLGILLSLIAATVVSAAQIKISELPLATSPSTNTFLLISDMDAATKSQKYLLTNLQTTLNQNSNLTVSNITSGGYLSLSGETNRVTVNAGALELDGSPIGGGDTIWDNTGGVIAPAGGQDTNTLSFTSGLADDAASVAVDVNTTSVWSDPGAKLHRWRNGNTEKLSISPFGGLLFSDDSVGDALLEAVAVSATGGWQTFYFTSQYNGVGAVGELSADVYADFCSFTHKISNGGNINWTQTPTMAQLALGITSAKRFVAEPTSDASTTPYKFYTENSHTSGDLAEFRNNGTNKFSIAFDGATTIAQSAAEPAAPAAGYFTLFGVDNGSGKMILKVLFPTGAAQTIATEP